MNIRFTCIAIVLSSVAASTAHAQEDVIPKPEQPTSGKRRLVADPVSDGAVLSASIGVGLLSEMIIGTGEIAPQQPQPNAKLLAIDQGVIDAEPSQPWRTASNVGLFSAVAFATVDPVLSGFRDGVEAGIVDAFIYAESVSITWSVTNLAKIAFRRPRPSAYQAQRELYEIYGPDNAPDITSTNSALSFFSGHASITSAVTATASYLAFMRSSAGSVRPWLTLGVGTGLTAMTAVGRVKGADHFPTDVIAGVMTGAGIGILVPHIHREQSAQQRPVWIGFGTVPGGAAVVVHGPVL